MTLPCPDVCVQWVGGQTQSLADRHLPVLRPLLWLTCHLAVQPWPIQAFYPFFFSFLPLFFFWTEVFRSPCVQGKKVKDKNCSSFSCLKTNPASYARGVGA